MKKFSTHLTLVVFLLFIFLSPLSTGQGYYYPDVDLNQEVMLDCPPVQNTPSFTIVYGNATINQENVPIGTVVKTFNPRGDLVGCFKTTSVGNYGMMFVYGEDNTINPPIPGMRPGETVTFTINDMPATSTPVLLWQNDRDVHNVNLEGQGGITADFSAEPLSGVLPLEVVFTDLSTGTIDNWSWDFGDGQTSTLQNPTHSYSNPGTYTVSLTVSGEAGSDTKTKTSYIKVYTPVVSDFGSDVTTGIAPLTVNFLNLTTGDYSSSLWNFGDSATSTLKNPSHTYSVGGTYDVSLTASGNGGSDTEIKNAYIIVYNRVTAGFTVDKDSGVYPLTVNFTNTSTGDYTNLSWDFGDGSTSELVNPTHTYQSKGSYQVTLTASGPGGTHQFSDTIDVYQQVEAEFTGNPLQGLSPLNVNFSNQSVGDYTNSLWDFGDGSTSTLKNPSHYYTVSGAYNVSLTISGPGGEDTITKTSYVNVFEPSQALFSANPTEGDTPLVVSFSNLSTGSFDTQTWDFGDGFNSNEFEPTHTYTSPGTYTVTLTINGPGGEATEIKNNYIRVFGPIVADFSASPLSGVAPLEVSFVNQSTGTINTYAWDFGDGQISDESSPIHTYSEPGTYTVRLTVTGPNGSDTKTKNNYIIVGTTAVADFSATPLSGVAPLEVAFSNLSTGTYDTYAWDFGDDTTSTLENPAHTYTEPGTYTVSLTVSGLGGTDTETKTGYITVYAPVSADFSATPLSGIAPLEVAFTNLSTGTYDTYAWDFGDGETSTIENPTHTYTDPGTYTVSLTVSGLGGTDTETKTGYITVYAPVSVDFSATPLSGVAPLEVAFTNLSTGTYDTYAWNFGDGETSTIENPTHTYTDPGTYTVSLTVSGLGGTDTETKTGYITVYAPVSADFSATPLSGVAPLEVAFTNLSTGTYDTYAWDFGDDTTSTLENPAHTYTEPGTYTVSLTVSGLGGTDTETKTGYITVYAPVSADFSATPLSGVAPLEVAFTNLSTGTFDTYVWDFGDDTTSALKNPTHTYSESGTYTVSLTVSGLGGTDTEIKTAYINVGSQVTAEFSATPLLGVTPLEVAFTNLSSGTYDTFAWDFGDGETSTIENPTHTYSQPGTYTVSLTVSGLGGTDNNTKTNYIIVYSPVIADFSATPLSGVSPLEVAFTNQSIGDYITSTWHFGDGQSSNEKSPTYTYSEPGTYTVRLTISGPGGTDTETKTSYITVYAPVSADFSATPLSGIAPLEVAFTNLSTGTYDTYAWDFGDGETSAIENPTHTYTDPGTYTVSLTVSGLGGIDTETKTAYITVYAPVSADFSATPLSGIAPLEVAFTNLSTGTYDTYAWDFGDGETSTIENPTHTYTDPGTYTVSLTVSGLGGTDTETKTAYITVGIPPVAEFSAIPLSGVAPLEVAFTNLSTGSYDTFAWDFGDGTTSTLENPSHTYTDPGTYTVSLTVSGLGGTDTETKTGYITVYTPVLANFSATPLSGVAPLEVAFTNLSTGTFDTYAWDFGDETNSALENPTHTYTEPGTYTVALTVSGLGGTDTETKTAYITVGIPPVAEFSATPLSGVAPLEVTFTNLSTGTYDTFAWDFGDGTTSTLENPSHTYTAQGTYTVSLTVSGIAGTDTETKTGYITVYAPVSADFSATPLSGVAPLEVAFTNLSTGTYDTYAWDFGDGETSMLENPTHTYTDSGTYNVSLTVSGLGGTDTETKTAYINVGTPVIAEFSATPLSGVAPLEVAFTNLSTGSYDIFAWDFGDGNTSTLENPTHIYSEPGIYTVSLTVSGIGGTDTETKENYITVFEPVEAFFTASPSTGTPPLVVQFTNQSTGSYDQIEWDFGDETSSQEPNPVHTFAEPGSYTVKLTVSGPGGSDSYELIIKVIPLRIYFPIILNQ